MGWELLISLAVSLVLSVISYVLAPKPKASQPESTRDLDNPTADAGRPIPVVFGTITVKGSNVVYSTDKGKRESKIRV